MLHFTGRSDVLATWREHRLALFIAERAGRLLPKIERAAKACRAALRAGDYLP